MAIHSGARLAADTNVVMRDEGGLTENVRGLTMINHTKLLTIDGDQFKIILPLYDYFIRSTNDDGYNSISMREAYETMDLTPSGTVAPVYQTLWNAFDFHGQSKGLRRLPGETNVSFRSRILDVYQHFPERGRIGALYGIRRELGLSVEDIDESPIKWLQSKIDYRNAGSVNITDDHEEVPYDEVDIEHQYSYGKYSHDLVTYKQSGTTVIAIDEDVVHDD
jgi:hypothetical protein